MSYSTRDQIDAAYDALIECALWSSSAYGPTDQDDPIPCDELHDESDIDDAILAELRADVRAYIEDNEADLEASGLTAEQIGHDFWLTREGHGAGFWDRGLPTDLGRRLTDAARVYGSVELGLYYRYDDQGERVKA